MKRAYALVASAGGQGEVTGWLLIHDSDGRAAGDPVQFEGILAEAGGDSTVVANASLDDAAMGVSDRATVTPLRMLAGGHSSLRV